MSLYRRNMVMCFLIGFVVGLHTFAFVGIIHHRIAPMNYNDGQVLMLLMDTYPEETTEARNYLLKCLKNGYISQWDCDYILNKATRAIFYEVTDARKKETVH